MLLEAASIDSTPTGAAAAASTAAVRRKETLPPLERSTIIINPANAASMQENSAIANLPDLAYSVEMPASSM